MENSEEERLFLTGEPEELGRELRTLYDLKIIDYKVVGKDTFKVGFTKDFVGFSEVYKNRLKADSTANMLKVIEETNQRDFDIETAIIMYYATVFLAYLEATHQIDRVDANDQNLLGGLIARLKEINETFHEAREREEMK